jgi:hypothetical protein
MPRHQERAGITAPERRHPDVVIHEGLQILIASRVIKSLHHLFLIIRVFVIIRIKVFSLDHARDKILSFRVKFLRIVEPTSLHIYLVRVRPSDQFVKLIDLIELMLGEH